MQWSRDCPRESRAILQYSKYSAEEQTPPSSERRELSQIRNFINLLAVARGIARLWSPK